MTRSKPVLVPVLGLVPVPVPALRLVSSAPSLSAFRPLGIYFISESSFFSLIFSLLKLPTATAKILRASLHLSPQIHPHILCVARDSSGIEISQNMGAQV